MIRTAFYKPLGFLFLGLAALGVVLPVLPTTPFLLLSAWFFARSSERWHAWLLQSRLFGPMIRDWEERKCISRRTKAVAVLSMLLVGGASVVFAMEALWLRLVTVGLLSVGFGVVLLIPTCPDADRPPT